MNIISIANQKGGTGKTTTCTNLAAGLAHFKRKVLAIDLDSQANLTSHFGLVPFDIELTVYDLIMNSNIEAQSVIRPLKKNLDLIPSNLNLASLDIELAGAVNRDQRLRRKLKDVSNHYDYILIDCPPALSFSTINAFTACDVLMVCVQTHMFSLTAVEKLLQTVNEVIDQYDLSIAAYALPTMYEKQSNAHKSILKKITEYFGPLTFSPIHKNVRCIDASIAGVPVIEMDRACSASIDYLRLAKEVIREFEKEETRRAIRKEFNQND
jgi:chromosome partitioning protein